jgi:hypothetical protein
VANAAWQAITSWSRCLQDNLEDTIYRLIPQWKKDQFKVLGVKKGIPRMEMVHYQDVILELRACLLDAQ